MPARIKKYLTTSTTTYGVSFGVLLFILRWLSITIIIFSSELLIDYGMLGAIGFMIAVGCAFFLFSILARRIKQKFHDKATLEEIIRSRTEGITRIIMVAILFLLNVSLLVIQAFAVHLMLQSIFEFPVYISQLIFYVLLFLYAGIGGQVILKFAPVFVIIIFSSVILIPVYFFIQGGIKPVYDGIWLYHPYLLYWKNNDNLPVILTSFLLYFSMLMVDRSTWQRLLLLKTSRVRRALSMSGVIIVTILLALLSMVLISLSSEGYMNASTVLFQLVEQLQPPLLTGLFISFCFVISLSAFGSELHTLVRTIKNWLIHYPDRKESTKLLNVPLFTAVMIIILFLAGLYGPDRILEWMFLYGIICTAMICPILVIIFTKKTLHRYFFVTILVPIAVGFIFHYTDGMFMGMWMTFITSVVLTCIQYIDQLLEKASF